MKYLKVEYDLNYTGGDYDETGSFTLIPLKDCDTLGVPKTFLKHIGVDPIHIINYNPNEFYDKNGNRIQD